MDQTQKENKLLVPGAIVIAGAFIAGAIYFGGTNTPARTANNQPTAPAVGTVAPVSPNEHIQGNPNAKVVIVTYTDYECPFCKTFHNTMRQILSTYSRDEVAFVYRHFPIAQLHSKAPKEAEAAECVTEQGGNTAFWKFSDKIFATTNSNDSLNPAELPMIAQAAGVDAQKFSACLASGKYTKTIDDAVAAAAKAGALGTPYSVAISSSGKKAAINGAQPFEVVKATIDSLLK